MTEEPQPDQVQSTLTTMTRSFSAMPLMIIPLVFGAIFLGRWLGLSRYGMLVIVLSGVFIGFGALVFSAVSNARETQARYLQEHAGKKTQSPTMLQEDER